MTAWIAQHYAELGLQPGIVLRGYGGDEGAVHRRLVEDAIVIENADRARGIEAAAEAGADVAVLDDAFQRLDVARDLNVVLVSAESTRAVRWTLPAGPWREGWKALRRADFIVITRKRADAAAARTVADRVGRVAPKVQIAIANLGVTRFRGLLGGGEVASRDLAGKRVIAAAGVADPKSFAAQCRQFGADVRLWQLRDHHPFTAEDVHDMLQVSRRVDYVVITEKDAVKLEKLWPETAPEPLVASLDVSWDSGRADFVAALDAAAGQLDDLLLA
jgi:tetraacyldisaccharide 4'-kinase